MKTYKCHELWGMKSHDRVDIILPVYRATNFWAFHKKSNSQKSQKYVIVIHIIA
jgi:hypothetical protein